MQTISKKLKLLFKKIILVSSAASITIGSSFGLASAAPKEVFSDRYAAIVIDANSGKTLFNANANTQRYPASLTKMMTLYLLFDAMKSGRVTPNTPIPVSAYAASRPPTKLGFKPNETIVAESAAKALITKSANDVAVAIGEYLGGTEKNFAEMMTEKAHQLGMMNTHFTNASGLPDKNNYSTAQDLAILSLALKDHFPNKYKWFKTLSFRFRGKEVRTHNHLVQHMKGVDGIKTGYTQMSGANLASSMHISGKNIVAVVMGGRTARLRDAHMASLLKRYLPKASKRKTRSLIIASATYNFKPASQTPVPVSKTESPILNLFAQNLNKSIPIPRQKNQIDPILPIITALTDEGKIQKNPAKDAIASVLIANNTSLFEKKEKKNKWGIQIGSMLSKKQAQTLLNKAKNTLPKSLKNKTVIASAFLKGKKQYYRARFHFQDKKEANRVCSLLKKHKFNCFLFENRKA